MVAATKNYLYTLPRDLEALQCVAIASTLNAALVCATGACHCQRRGSGEHLTLLGLQYLTGDFARTHLTLEIEGKRGTNDEKLLRSIFLQMVARVYRPFLAFLLATPEARDSLSILSYGNRWTALERIAARHLAAVLALDQVLTFAWPLLPPEEQEAADGCW